MTTVDEFCAALLSEVGYVETPDNITKFAAEAGHPNGYAWCMTMLVAIAKRTGLTVPYLGSNTLACADAFRAAGKLYQDPQAGDWVVFHGPDFPEGHIEGVIGVDPDGSLDDVGGNTSDGIHGSQWNGGMVARRHRPRAQIVGFCRPDYTTQGDDEVTDQDKQDIINGVVAAIAGAPNVAGTRLDLAQMLAYIQGDSFNGAKFDLNHLAQLVIQNKA